MRLRLGILVLLTLGGCGFSLRQATTSATAALPAKSSDDVPFAPVLFGGSLPTHTCTARDFKASSEAPNGAGGDTRLDVHFTDTAATACEAEGFPHVAAPVPGQMAVVGTDSQSGFFAGIPVVPVGVAPRLVLDVAVETHRDCPARYANPRVYPSLLSSGLVITMPDGSTLNVDGPLDVLCGLFVAPFMAPAPPAPTENPPAFSLQPSIVKPVKRPQGGTLAYSVVLKNTERSPVSLAPCPWYTETTLAVAQTFLLNCAAAPKSIASGRAVTLQMEIPAQSGVALTEVDWSWGSGWANSARRGRPEGGGLVSGGRGLGLSAFAAIS